MAKKKKLSEEEKLYSDLLQAANNVISLWMEFRRYFRMAFSNQEIKPEMEQQFLDIKSNMARLQRFLGQRLPRGFHYGSQGITDMMSQSISIEALRDLPLTDKKGLYEKWHGCYMRLQNLLGILDVMHEGYEVTFEDPKSKSGNIKVDQAAASKKGKKKDNSGTIKMVVAIAAIAGAIFYIINK